MNLILELFVSDLSASVSFYHSVLSFEKVLEKPGGFTIMKSGKTQIDIQPRSNMAESHPIRPASQERMGLGIEIVLEVEDVNAAHERVLEQGWPLSAQLHTRPWGATDFRVIDPDGCYIRVTSGLG
jgi:catechol 2,3-dioxygenase-like lactoylglutathione lyase family enzyme